MKKSECMRKYGYASMQALMPGVVMAVGKANRSPKFRQSFFFFFLAITISV